MKKIVLFYLFLLFGIGSFTDQLFAQTDSLGEYTISPSFNFTDGGNVDYSLTYSLDGKNVALLITQRDELNKRQDGLLSINGVVLKTGASQLIPYKDKSGFIIVNRSYETGLPTIRILSKDGLEIGKYENADLPTYSSDFSSFTYRVRQNGKFKVIKDGVESKTYDYIDNLVYSPDGKSFSFGAGEGRKTMLVIDGVESDKFDAIKKNITIGVPSYNTEPVLPSITYLPDGKGYYFEAYKDFGSSYSKYLIKDGVINIKDTAIIYSPNGKSSASIRQYRNYSYVVKDGVINGRMYYQIGLPMYSPDGAHFFYVGQKTNGDVTSWCMVKDGTEIGSRGAVVGTPIFSPDGKNLIYALSNGSTAHLIKDGADNTKYTESRDPIYSSDGKRFAFIAKLKNGKWVVVVNGVESHHFEDRIDGLKFSPDGVGLTFFTKKITGGGSEIGITDFLISLVTYNELNKKTLSNEQEEGWVKPSSNANSKAIQLANSIINRVNTIAKDDIEKRNALIKQLRDRLESLAEFELDKKKRDIWINIRRFLE